MIKRTSKRRNDKSGDRKRQGDHMKLRGKCGLDRFLRLNSTEKLHKS